MVLKTILFLVFGVALVCNAVATRKVSKKVKDIEHKINKTNERIECIRSKCRLLAEDIKNIRLEISSNSARKPLSEKYFEDMFYIDFSKNIAFKDKYLEYVARVGITSIASEIPEEKRTRDVMMEIIRRMQMDLDKNQVIKI